MTSHFPLAGSVFQWSKYMANRTYSWFTGWIYLFAGILTVTSVVATLPLALIPALNGLGWHGLGVGGSSTYLHTELIVALITLVVITVLNIYGVRLVAIINNTGVLFEILGMFVFAIVLDSVPQPPGLPCRDKQRRFPRRSEHVPRGYVHEPVRHLRVRHRFDPGRRDKRPTPLCA